MRMGIKICDRGSGLEEKSAALYNTRDGGVGHIVASRDR